MRSNTATEPEGEHRRACVMGFPGGGFSVALVEHRPDGGGDFDPRRPGLDHLAFTVTSRAALEEWCEHFDRHQVKHSGVIAITPGVILNFKDPDGVSLALFWDDPLAARYPHL